MKNGIIIPCHNEASKFNKKLFVDVIRQAKGYEFCFVNHGSTDETLEVLNFIRRSANSPNVYIYNLPENAGKIDAIKQGSLFLRDYSGSPTAGFLEVDLSTALKSIDEV